MRYGLTFLTLALLLAFMAIVFRGWYWLALWPAVSFFGVAVAYLGAGPRVFGKRGDGTLHPAPTIVLLPYHLLSWGAWHTLRLCERRNAWNEIASGLIIGRRVLAGELPDGVSLVVDLTSEFAEARDVRTGRNYLCLPMLDASVVSDRSFRAAVQQVTDWPGLVYVHCAQGHGRSAAFSAAVLLVRGLAADPDDAVRIVRAARPGVELKTAQRELVRRFARRLEPAVTSL